ncbi:Hypothetical predicted protein [Octopus vulgaris]|uniref:Uncharacterized protein n=1 Tax=Octopus vulgaris TaxID=6645 RepID=A0AA36BFP4_OCTVU|nr:Hypothetical predicted protein [Octopus vulgaris]
MIRQDQNKTQKKSNVYQIINTSVKYPNVTFRSLVWYCEDVCSATSNCCGYSYKNGQCQLLIMTYCWNSKVLLTDGNYIDLTKPIAWTDEF